MISAKIKKGETSVVEATGAVPELLTDIAVLVNAIHTQLRSANPKEAAGFRVGLIGFLSDPDSAAWKPMDGQTGIIFPKLEE